jgi:hypothetical protein
MLSVQAKYVAEKANTAYIAGTCYQFRSRDCLRMDGGWHGQMGDTCLFVCYFARKQASN